MAEKSKTSRRAFLKGRAAVEALGDAIIGPPPELPPPQAMRPASTHLLTVSREAMACLFEIVFDAASYRHLTEAAIEALDLVAALEQQLTVYRDSSEVMLINRRASEEPVEVEAGLFQLLVRAVDLSVATGGAVDITAGPLSKVWGFYRRQGRMPEAAEIAAALELVGSENLQLDRDRQTVRFANAGMELNLGAVGKGYALDKAAAHLVSAGIDSFLIHGGNSSVFAKGSRNAESELQTADSAESSISNVKSAIPWTVGLKHPLKPDVRLAEFALRNQALGTSGSGTQFFHHEGKRLGHILDPRTGWPADKVLSATVIAPTAEQADALSTALYVMGLEAARHFCANRPDIGALLVTVGEWAGSVELFPINLADDAWRRL